MIFKEYTKEFYKVNIRAGYKEERYEKIVRYINGLKLDIQDEINLLSLSIVEEAYQCDLKVEEKLSRKQGSNKWKGQVYEGKGQQTRRNKPSAQKEETSGSNQQRQSSREDDCRGKRPIQKVEVKNLFTCDTGVICWVIGPLSVLEIQQDKGVLT